MCFGLQEAWRLPHQPSSILSDGSVYSSLKVDSIKLMELLGPEKVDPSDVKLIKEKLFGYSTFWVTREELFGDLGEVVLFLGNLRGKREDDFARLQHQLNDVTGDKYNLFMVEELNSEGPDPRDGPSDVGHSLAAFPKKVKLGIPFFIPNITLDSFGAITQVSMAKLTMDQLLGKNKR